MNRSGFGARQLGMTAAAIGLLCIGSLTPQPQEPHVVQAKPMPAGELPGERPYEMVRAGRRPPYAPLVNFDSLDGWTALCEGGAMAELVSSQKQRVWESPVARLVYRGSSPQSTVTLRPPQPVPIPRDASATTVWIFGNNWAWAPDPTTPRVNVDLVLKDESGKEQILQMVNKLGWKEWFLVHRVIPPTLLSSSLTLTGIRITGCANTEDRELYFEDLAFIKESFKPLSFASRPKRGVDPFPGQDSGPNNGPGRLPFPTREETILPENLASKFESKAARIGKDTISFAYNGADGRVEYQVKPNDQGWGPVAVKLNNSPVGQALVGAGPEFEKAPTNLRLTNSKLESGVLQAIWRGLAADGSEIVVESRMRLWQKSLVVDYFCRGGSATGLSYGRILDVPQPELILLPFINYGSHHLHVLMSSGAQPCFASVWMDWYRSNASQPYAEDRIAGTEVLLNGGVRYLPKTDGKRNDLFERFFLTFSPVFEETLPTVANPPAKRGKEAGARLWQESWGPEDYAKEQERSEKLRSYGIEQLTRCNHEITWRDGGESFTFRTEAAPVRGGDEALKKFVAAQRALGWRSGLYTNYCDFAPVNAFWDTDMVMRATDGNLVQAWARCYSPKALFAVEMDAKLAPAIQKKFNSNAAYTDVHTSVSPWERTDYDARAPGAGTFAATFYPYGELLLHDQDVYDGHCWSEGNHQWLYAGLCTGNYGLTYSDLRLWKYPYLPHFDLLKMHPLSVDIGIPWTAQFFQGKEGWNKPENIESSIDQFIAATAAYGHMGWLVEEEHGIRQTCRSYYMLQQLQSRYAMQKPEEIRYGGPKGTMSSSEALLNSQWKASRLYIKYPGGLELWVNGNASENWDIENRSRKITLPPFGWLAVQGNDFYEASEIVNGKRCDRASSAEYVFVDGRGSMQLIDGLSTSGSLAVRPGQKDKSLSIIAVDGVETIVFNPVQQRLAVNRLADLIAEVGKASNLDVQVFDAEGKNLGSAQTRKTSDGWEIKTQEKGRRYEVAIGAQPSAATQPGRVVFFDDFDGSRLDTTKWRAGLHHWGRSNNGVVPDNVRLAKIEDEGKQITVLDTEAHGDLYKGPVKGVRRLPGEPGKYERTQEGTRVGGLVISQQKYGAGRYEVRMKNLPLSGGCSCIWNYLETKSDYTEIDIEMPANGKAETPNWANWAGLNTYYPGPQHINEKVFDLGAPQNDGKFHVYRWDWYTNGEARVEFYLDGRLLFTSTKNIPKSPAELWVGNWPAFWSGNFKYDTQHLYVDWVKITELR